MEEGVCWAVATSKPVLVLTFLLWFCEYGIQVLHYFLFLFKCINLPLLEKFEVIWSDLEEVEGNVPVYFPPPSNNDDDPVLSERRLANALRVSYFPCFQLHHLFIPHTSNFSFSLEGTRAIILNVCHPPPKKNKKKLFCPKSSKQCVNCDKYSYSDKKRMFEAGWHNLWGYQWTQEILKSYQ